MGKITHGSLFSGIGGFDLAAEWARWENLFHCEINEFGRKVLNYYWPNAISYEDITKTDFTIWRGKIDVLTGGFPCQPYSMAGKRLGKEDERHLWPEMLRVIREVQPTWVVGENVPGLFNWSGGLVFDEVQSDLEAEGYEVIPFILPAASVNAPHRRERVWFVAYRNSSGLQEERPEQQTTGVAGSGIQGNASNSESVQNIRRRHGGFQSIITRINAKGTTPNSESPKGKRTKFEQREAGEQKQRQLGGTGGEICYRNASDPRNKGLQRSEKPGIARSIGEESNKQSTLFFRTDWQNFPTVSPIHERNDGLSDRLSGITFSKWRNEAVKACGNAIVPQVVFQIFKAIIDYEQNKNLH